MSQVSEEHSEIGYQHTQLMGQSRDIALSILLGRCFKRTADVAVPFYETLKRVSE